MDTLEKEWVKSTIVDEGCFYLAIILSCRTVSLIMEESMRRSKILCLDPVLSDVVLEKALLSLSPIAIPFLFYLCLVSSPKSFSRIRVYRVGGVRPRTKGFDK